MAKGVTDINNSNNQKSVSIDVIESHTLNITFTQYTTGPLFGITNRVTGYNPTASAQASFINATYPVADDGIIINVEPTTLRQWSLSGLFDCYDTSNFKMLLKAHGLGNSSGYTFDKVVGVVPYGDLYSSVGQPQGMIMGCVAQDKTLRSAILLVDGSPNATLAHELGHTYNLCHDTPESNWNWSQLLFNGCVNRNINGHYNGNNCDGTYCYIPNGTNLLVLHLFDAAMISGGNTTTNNPSLVNFMRPITNTGMPADWVDNETYTLLLNIFAINHARVFTSMDVITLAGDITNTSSGGFDKAMYVAHGGLIDNASDYSTGNVNVVALNAQGAIIYNYSYAPTFAIAFSGGELGTTNKSSFVFKIPRSNISSIRLYKDGQLLDSRTISQNAPITNLTAPQSGRVYEGLFNVTWNSSDVDGDPTYQAVLLSADSGQTWTPLGIDINGSHFAMDTSGYAPGSNYKLQLLSTDGVNTNATFSGTFTMIPPPHIAVLNITELYGDGSREVFEADAKNDGVYYNLSTVNWTLNTGTELLSGAKYNTLAVGEQMDVLVEYNYASSGTQIVVFTARDDNKSVADFKSISVNVGGQTNNPLLSCNFVGTNCNFTGFANHNSIAGYIEETENWSDSIVSPGLNLSSLSAYHFVIKAELGHVGITKLWFKANNAADSGPDYIFDDAGSTMNWKFEGDSYSTISNIPLNRNITITVYVNSTSNKTYSTLDWGDGSGTTANQTFVNTNYDYARFSVGQIFQAPVRIRSWEVWNDALNSSLSNSSNGSQTPSALLKNYTFTSSNEEFALNSGWNWDRGAGILRYNGSDNGGTLASPSVNLSKYPNGYNITLVLSTGNITNTKLYINSPNGGLAGARYNMEHATDTTQHFKYDGGSWSSTDDYSIGTYQTMLISVNLTSNMTKVCRVGGTCSNSEAMGTYTVGDYFGIVPGVVMNGTQDINITTIEIWAIS